VPFGSLPKTDKLNSFSASDKNSPKDLGSYESPNPTVDGVVSI
jgi:hypothetical protein